MGVSGFTFRAIAKFSNVPPKKGKSVKIDKPAAQPFT